MLISNPVSGLLAPTFHRSNLLVRHSVHFVHEMVQTLTVVWLKGENENLKDLAESKNWEVVSFEDLAESKMEKVILSDFF